MTSTPSNEAYELRAAVLTEFKQVHKLAPADYTENCTNVVMALLEAYAATQVNQVLDEAIAKRSLLTSIEFNEKVVPVSVLQSLKRHNGQTI